MDKNPTLEPFMFWNSCRKSQLNYHCKLCSVFDSHEPWSRHFFVSSSGTRKHPLTMMANCCWSHEAVSRGGLMESCTCRRHRPRVGPPHPKPTPTRRDTLTPPVPRALPSPDHMTLSPLRLVRVSLLCAGTDTFHTNLLYSFELVFDWCFLYDFL